MICNQTIMLQFHLTLQCLCRQTLMLMKACCKLMAITARSPSKPPLATGKLLSKKNNKAHIILMYYVPVSAVQNCA